MDFILPHQLPHALDDHPTVRVLSLDCFDTLLWRDTHAPRDLFGALPDTTVPQRQWAESRARSASVLNRRKNEVGIEEIYAELVPNGTDEERAAAVAAELAAEARHCYAFLPTVELMRAAKRTGRQVIIVSDTYLDTDQLRGLIAAAAGEDVAGMIDRLFCSSVYGASKSEGLYRDVLAALPFKPEEILHIGDNKKADVVGVAPFGVKTLHLKQFSETTEQRLRLESGINAMLHPGEDGRITSHQPHRAALSAHEPQIADDAEGFGFSAIGPVFYGFERWLQDEAHALAASRGGKVHWLFLMRDGHLPMLVHRAVTADGTGHPVEISRFTATGSSFEDEAAVMRYLQAEICGDLRAVARQLLMPSPEIADVLRSLPRDKAPAAFLQAVRKPNRMARILKASASFAERLVAHVRALVDPAPGDTLMLVDLGYNGTVQNQVEAVLSRGLDCHVAGRYLLLREQYRTGYDKRGFFDSRHYDANTLESFAANVAVIEQLCTAAQGSVVDYKADGTPVRRETTIKARQSEIRDRVQAGTIGFARAQDKTILRVQTFDEATLWRRASAAAMGRLMFLPLPQELAVVNAFEHDVNLGVDDTVALFDQTIAHKGLRERGLFYMKGSERMYLPAELNGEGLALKLSLLAHKRFGLPLKYADFVDRSIALPVIVADGTHVTTGNVTATQTHDGYYMAPIPIGDCRFSVGLQFGQLFEWLQIESAHFLPVERFLSDKQRAGRDEIEARPSLEGMEQTAPNLFRCEDAFSFMMVPPPRRKNDQPMMLMVVFRPIVHRLSENAAAQAPAQSRAAA